MERDFVIYGGAAPDSGTGAAEPDKEQEEEDEDSEPVASVSGTISYLHPLLYSRACIK